MTRDQWLLTGAWAAMAAFGSLTYYKVSQSPEIDPGVAAAIQALKKAEEGGISDPPGKAVPFKPPFGRTEAGLAYVDPDANRFRPKFSRIENPHPRHPVQVLPLPVMGAATASLDGVTVEWSLQRREVPLKDWMDRKMDTKPQGFIVLRQVGDGAAVLIAELGPEAKSYTDLSAEPKQTYRYIVSAKGMEHDRMTDPPVLAPVTVKAARPASAQTPSATRIKLVGGDKAHAVLKAETYNKEKKCWVQKTLLVDPGQAVASTGWTLKGLRFDNFTLVADVTDDDGVARVLTTGE